MAHEENVDELVRQISMAAYRFGAAADDICGDLGVTGAMRGVLSAALASERATVPQLARTMGVSRQHVQKLADQLWAAWTRDVSTKPCARPIAAC